MQGTLRVTPEKLIAESNNFNSTAGQISNITSNMVSTVAALSSTWAGDAATVYNNKVRGLQESINKMIKMVREHSADLTAMAQAYQEAERAGQEAANSLKTDIIV